MGRHPVPFWELASHNAEESVAFFEKVFEWEFDYDEESTIYDTRAGDLNKEFYGGLIFTLKKAKLPFLTIYIQVEDIDAKAKLIEENGGFLVEPPFNITDKSRICLFNEPSGVTFAMIQKS
ncbi:MAG: VOC family protein [Promethearchaeota archaeon]|jgi:predicted enzyme related to lactoylglutathione lyase